MCLSLFFPCFTGILSGANRASALRDPVTAIPHGTLGAASAGMLSVDGRCKTLDARANGYARSEGVGAVLALSLIHI